MTPNIRPAARGWRTAASRFVRDETGATAIEYALMAVFIAIAIITSVTAIGGRLTAIFTTTSTAF